jgi:hypothetical protein
MQSAFDRCLKQEPETDHNMKNTKANKRSARNNRKLLMVAVTILTVGQSAALYAGHPGTDPRPSNNTPVVQKAATTTSSTSLLSDIRREYERLRAILLSRLSPGPH